MGDDGDRFASMLSNYMRLDLQRRNRETSEMFREQRLIRDEQRRIMAQQTRREIRSLENGPYGSMQFPEPPAETHIPQLDEAGRIPDDLIRRMPENAIVNSSPYTRILDDLRDYSVTVEDVDIPNASAKLKKCIHYLKKTYEVAKLYNVITEEEKRKIEKLIGTVP